LSAGVDQRVPIRTLRFSAHPILCRANHEVFADAIGTFYPDGRDPATLDIFRGLKD
jgi:hypothetical protein